MQDTPKNPDPTKLGDTPPTPEGEPTTDPRPFRVALNRRKRKPWVVTKDGQEIGGFQTEAEADRFAKQLNDNAEPVEPVPAEPTEPHRFFRSVDFTSEARARREMTDMLSPDLAARCEVLETISRNGGSFWYVQEKGAPPREVVFVQNPPRIRDWEADFKILVQIRDGWAERVLKAEAECAKLKEDRELVEQDREPDPAESTYECSNFTNPSVNIHGKSLPEICNELHARGREVVQAFDNHGDGNRGWTVLHRARGSR